MPSVLLAGAFGQRNPGDEMLLAAFVRALPGWTAVATSRDPAGTQADHGIRAVAAGDAPAVARELAQADAVVFAGGTVFKLLAPTSGRRPLELLRNGLALATAARALGRPVALVGVGAGDLQGRRAAALARALVHRCDLLVLRDEDSAAALHAAGAPAPFRVGADPAWTLLGPQPPSPMPVRAQSNVIVALSHHAGGTSFAARLSGALARLDAAGLRIVLQPWQPGADERMAEALAAAVALEGASAEIAPVPADLPSAAATFEDASVVLALRFHALVAAGAAGTRVVAIAHEAKLAALARRLGQRAVLPASPDDEIAAAVMGASVGPPPDAEAVAQEINRAEEGFRLLRILLSRGHSTELRELGGLELAPQEWVA